jgi:tetratricopeptide (TPR) repeat protein
MPVTISGYTAATPKDLELLESRLGDSLRKTIASVEESATKRHAELAEEIKSLRSDLEDQTTRIAALNAAQKELTTVLTAISEAAGTTATEVQKVTQALADNGKVMDQVVSQLARQIAAETARRQELQGGLAGLVSQHEEQTRALDKMFLHLQVGIKSVEDAQANGAEAIANTLHAVHDDMENLRVQAQEGFSDVAEQVGKTGAARQEQGEQEAVQLASLLSSQERSVSELGTLVATLGAAAQAGEQSSARAQTLDRDAGHRSARALNDEGVRLYNEGETETARALLEQAVQLAQDDPRIAVNLALAQMRAGMADQARALLADQVERGSPNPEALNALGLLYLEQNQPDVALGYLQQAMALAPADPAVLLNAGKAYYRCGQVQPALAAWRHAAAANPVLAGGDPEVVLALEEQAAQEAGL